MERRARGYIVIMLMFVVTVMGIGLLVAVPVWQTQIQREKEEELIFRGKQYVEAVRLFQLKKPGAFPKSLEELVEERCLRRLFKDPMSEDGRWNIVLLPQRTVPGSTRRGPAGGSALGREEAPARDRGQGQALGAGSVLVAPESALSSIRNAQILGVVSSSTRKSIRIYNQQESYDKWLFFYGQDPKRTPEIEYYGRSPQ
jgi:type II secretory pathway pseudopilin PulG